jgi:glutamate carboxypeptidase
MLHLRAPGDGPNDPSHALPHPPAPAGSGRLSSRMAHPGRALAVLLLSALPASAAAQLAPAEERLLSTIDARREAATALLARTVDVESATENHAGVRAVAEIYAAELAALGFATRFVDQAEVGRAGHLVAEHHGTAGRRLLLVGHLDTVLQGEPFRRDGARAYGSGISDMKGGNLIAIEALRGLYAVGALQGRQVIVVLTGDEEDTGTPYERSRAALREVAARSDVALAFEGYEPGTAVVGRRGFSSWRLEVTGSQGHSSQIFGEERGSGAIFEASRILTAFHDTLREPFLTFNPSVIVGGTVVRYDPATFSGQATGKTNVVPGSVVVEGDMRFLTRAQLEAARERMKGIVAASLPRTSATIAFTDGMPSMEPSEANRALLGLVDAVSRDMGEGPIVAHDPSRRGAGDVSFISPPLAALDGLGALGAREHAPGESVELAAIPLLTRRAALLMYRLLRAE